MELDGPGRLAREQLSDRKFDPRPTCVAESATARFAWHVVFQALAKSLADDSQWEREVPRYAGWRLRLIAAE
jgi:hypothetical protein